MPKLISASFVVIAFLTLTSCRNNGLSARVPTGGARITGGPPASRGGSNGSGGSSGVADTGGVSGRDGSGESADANPDGSGADQAVAGIGGTTGLGGASADGGTVASGGSGGTAGPGGASTDGATVASGGSVGTGGAGTTGAGGLVGQGGSGSGGISTQDAAAGGQTDLGGSAGTGGASGSGGTTDAFGPCDIYLTAGTPCVAVFSTVRALYGAYPGPLYQVRRYSDGSTTDIPVEAPGGFVRISVQDSFCAGTTCTISILYDQSPNENHLKRSPDTLYVKNFNEASATPTAAKVTVAGHAAYGIYFNNPTANVGYRNNNARGLATGDQSEAMYMVLDGKRYSTGCCFDFGNVGAGTDEGSATVEALYWGAYISSWPGTAGGGPWVGADFGGGGIFECDGSRPDCASTSITGWDYVTGMLKGPAGKAFGLKAGNAQSAPLETEWAGARPAGDSPMQKQGAIVLGTGGDGSNNGVGIFFEGAITIGSPPDSTDDAVQANIVSAGYGR